MTQPRVLLLQARRADDPAAPAEVRSFLDKTGLADGSLGVHNLVEGPPSLEQVLGHDALMVGGSGEYFVSRRNLPPAEVMPDYVRWIKGLGGAPVFVAYPLVVNGRENIVMAEIRSILPEKANKRLDLVIALASLGACALIAGVTATTSSDNLNNATPTLKIPFWIFLAAAAFGFAGAAFLHLRRLRRGQDAGSIAV